MMKSILTAALLLFPSISSAQSSITSLRNHTESYVVVIGAEDLYNSKGQRLTQPWQVIRQDRANLYSGRSVTPGDEYDSLYGDSANRARMETLLANGHIERRSVPLLFKPGTIIIVDTVFEGSDEYIEVKVLD